MKQAMKRMISLMMSLALFVTLFAGLSINASAASDDWDVYNSFGYYDAEEDIDYHVVFSFQQSYKKILWIKDYYISQMKVDTYATTRSGRKATVIQTTSILPKNSKTGINNCMDYIEKCCPRDLRNAYLTVLEDQKIYRTFYLWEQGQSVPNEYVEIYEKFVCGKINGYLDDAIKEALGFSLPACLEPLSAASAVQNDAEELKELSEYIIFDLNRLVWYYWDYRMGGVQEYGISSVKDLFNAANNHTTSSKTTTKSLRYDNSVKLANDIYTHPLG